MKRMKAFIPFLAILGIFLLSACGGSTSVNNGTPNADPLVTFNEQGISVIEGSLLSGSVSSASNGVYTETLEIAVPVKVDGIKTSAVLPVRVRSETEIISSLTRYTTFQQYMIYNPGSSAYKAFPESGHVQVTLKKNGAAFEAVSIRENDTKPALFKSWDSLNGIVTTDGFTRGTIPGSIRDADEQGNGDVLWTLSVPVQVQGVDAHLLLRFESARDTVVTTPDGIVPTTSDFAWDAVQIDFTRRGQTLSAHQITVLP